MSASLSRRVLSTVASSSLRAPSSLIVSAGSAAPLLSRSSAAVFTNAAGSNALRSFSTASGQSSELPSRSTLWLAASVAAAAATVSSLALNGEAEDKIERSGLSPKDFRPFTVKKIYPYNHDTRLYVLKLKDANVRDVLPITSFVLVRHVIDGKEEVRPYTPIESHEPGELRLLIKSYPNGKISKYFGSLKEGDSVEVKGPLGKLNYVPNSKKEIGCLAGGTGITPVLQLVDAILRNPQDKTKVTVVFFNKTSADILLKEKLDILQRFAPDRFKVHYVIDKPEPKWNSEVGFVSQDIVQHYMPKPSDDNLITVCGPLPFYKLVSGTKAPDFSQGELEGFLKALGYNKNQVFKF